MDLSDWEQDLKESGPVGPFPSAPQAHQTPQAPQESQNTGNKGNIKVNWYLIAWVLVIVACMVILFYTPIYDYIIRPYWYGSPYRDDACVLSGFANLDAARLYIEDPSASRDIQLRRAVMYSILPRPCDGTCGDIISRADAIVAELRKQKVAFSVPELEAKLLRLWNGESAIADFPVSLHWNLRTFLSHRQRLPPQFTRYELRDFKYMLYVNTPYSPFWVDCTRSYTKDLVLSPGACTKTNCRKSENIEPNYDANFFTRDKFNNMTAADAYVNDPGISDECRLIRAGLLIPIAVINDYETDAQAKTRIEVTLGCNLEIGEYNSRNSPEASEFGNFKTVEDLETYIMGMVKGYGWDIDMTTLRRLLYTTELGNPKRANSVQHLFYQAQNMSAFNQQPKVDLSNSFSYSPSMVSTNSQGNPIYINASGQPHYPNDEDDAGNPIYVNSGGSIHYLYDPASGVKRGTPIYTNSGRDYYPNQVDENGFPMYLNSTGKRHYYPNDLKYMQQHGISYVGERMTNTVHANGNMVLSADGAEKTPKLKNRHDGNRFASVNTMIQQ